MAGALVERRKKSGRFLAAQGLGDFEIAAGGGIHADVLVFGFEREAVEVLRQLALGKADVVEQRAGGADGGGVFFFIQPEAAQILAAEIVGEQLCAAVGRKLPGVQPRDVGRLNMWGVGGIGQQDFRRLQACQFVGEFIGCDEFGFEFAALQRCPSKADVFFVAFHAAHGHDAVGFFVFQKSGIGERAGGDDAHHFALHRPFGGTHFACLLANGHALAHFHKPGQILLGGMIGHAGHFNRLAVELAARGEGDV